MSARASRRAARSRTANLPVNVRAAGAVASSAEGVVAREPVRRRAGGAVDERARFRFADSCSASRLLASAALAAALVFAAQLPLLAQDTPHTGERAEEPARPTAPGDSPPRGPADIFKQKQQKKTPAPAAPGENPPGNHGLMQDSVQGGPGTPPSGPQGAPGHQLPGKTQGTTGTAADSTVGAPASRSGAAAASPGSAAPSSAAQGNTAPGSAAQGNAAPGNTAPGNTAPGSAAPGSAAPGSAAPGSASPTAAPTGSPSTQAAPGATSGELPAGHPEVGEGVGAPPGAGAQAGDAPVGGDPHAGQPDAPPLSRKPIATAEPDASLPPGTIRVRVIDSVTEQPVPNAKLQLGTMNRDNSRNTQDATTGPNGEYRFEKLAAGEGQAYRINELHDGAKYSSTPFRLPTEQGYDVLIRQLPTTRDPREVVLYVGATSVEVRDERLKVVQQARLINIGSKTYVFPDDGLLIKFPTGYTAFQAEEVMTDQHMKEETNQGMRLTGSIAPGETTLTWGFDFPYDTTTVDLSFDLPWVTFAYRVLADAAPGMALSVDDMPPAELHEDNGRRFWVSEVVKRVGDPPLRSLKIHVTGIPGPGPTRIIALVLALFVLGGGLWFARRPPPAATAATIAGGTNFEERKAELLAQAAQLERDRARDEIGPEFYAQQIADLEEQLAALLFEQSQKPSAKPKAA